MSRLTRISPPLHEELLRTGFEHQRLEPACFRGRRLPAGRREPEVPPPLVLGIARAALSRLLDQSPGQHAPQRAVEVSGHDLIEAAALLDFANEAPAVALA